MIRRPPRSTLSSSSAASDVYKRQPLLTIILTASVLALQGSAAENVSEKKEVCPVVLNLETVRARDLERQIDGAKSDAATLAALRAGWTNPPSSYRPHTRWWWPGNAVTKEGIAWQLEQMKNNGFGGVEIMSFLKVYDKGNIEFGTPEFFDMVHYACLLYTSPSPRDS